VDHEHVRRAENLREQSRTGSDSTSEVEHGFHRHAQPIQTLLHMKDAPAREVFLALSGYGERLRQRRVVVGGVSIEVGHGPGDLLAYRRCPSRVTTLSYPPASSSARAGKWRIRSESPEGQPCISTMKRGGRASSAATNSARIARTTGRSGS